MYIYIFVLEETSAIFYVLLPQMEFSLVLCVHVPIYMGESNENHKNF
jgi:hypothetical protein